MPVPRKSDASHITASPAPDHDRVHPTLRWWLVSLALLVTIPWVVVAALYTWNLDETPIEPGHRSLTVAGTGPWGKLAATPIVVSPPLEYVSTVRHPLSRGTWAFPETTPQAVESFLMSAGLTTDQLTSVRTTMRSDSQIRGVIVTPDDSLVRGLSPEVRARIYVQLAKTYLNVDQAQAFRFEGDTPEAWLFGGVISSRTRELVAPLIYRDGALLYFADMHLIRDELDSAELQRLHKVMNRRPTWLLALVVENAAEVAQLDTYWGRGGRHTDIRALLESVVGLGPNRPLDIVHLLPQMARDRLYRFPRLSPADLVRPVIANCLWTSLNFFNRVPDDRYFDVQHALDVLKNDYYVVRNNFLLGDVVAFLDTNGNIFHTAVYIADDFVFTKNGVSAMAPWTIMKLNEVKEIYRFVNPNPQVLVNRRQDF